MVSTGKMHLSKQNSIAATEVTSLAVTKLDGTAKGGVVIGIQFKISVKYDYVGEGIEDFMF
jgi:fused signal recognition particle receptor